MLLKNLMEEKHLNLDQPLLSVRRSSPPKTSENQNLIKTDKQPPLPRIPRLRPHKTEVKSGPVTNPGTVPFLWEQLPGRPKEEIIISQDENSINPLIIAPKLPPGKTSQFNQPLERESFRSGDSDEAYLDALDTFWSSESVFLNCSTSGLTLSDEVEVNPSRNLLIGSSTRDFMMDRFLPAAKAMASDAPQVTNKPRELKKMTVGDEPSMQNGPSLMKDYLQIPDNGDEEEEDKDEEETDDDQGGILPAVCGLLPRFCSKRSCCVIHTITAMSMRARLPKSSVSKLRGGSSVAASLTEKDDEIRSNFSSRNSVGDFNSNSRPDGQLRGHGAPISLDESADEEKGRVNFSEEANKQGINSVGSDNKTGYKTFGDFLSEKDDSEESSHSTIPVVEKTLYVDVVHKVDKEDKVVTKMTNQSSSADSSVEDSDNVESLVISSDSNGLSRASKFCEQDKKNNKVSTITTNEENLRQRRLQFPIPPPSPISPSESWLRRTLPSMRTRNSYLHPHLRGANHQKEVSNGQWETLVKTAKA